MRARITGGVRAVLIASLVLASLASTGVAAATDTATTERIETHSPTIDERAGPALGSGDGAATADSDDGDDSDDGEAPDDPEEDVIGWEAGYWYNESIDVNNLDGLDDEELSAVVNRTVARVEYIRDKEFLEPVPVTVISRAEFRNSTGGTYTEDFRTFDNAKFEAMFFVGENDDSLVEQDENLGSSVAGYYSPTDDSIVLISDTGEVQLDGPGTLSHELVHALQDQHFDLAEIRAETRDQDNGQSGIVEGEANFIQYRYEERCGAEWECIDSPDASDGGLPEGFNWGIYFLGFLPYSDGPSLIEHLYELDGWDAVDDAYDDDLPTSSEQVIYPERYSEGGEVPRDVPTEVELTDDTADGWERLEVNGRPSSATLGQAAISSMLIHTSYDSYNRSALVSPPEFLNLNETGAVDDFDPVNYDLAVSEGWDGDRMHVYTNPDAAENETAYVWRLVWDTEADAREFARGYRALLTYWDGERVAEDTYRVSEDSPFTDSFYVDVEGDTVTVVNAPTTDDLGDVYDVEGDSTSVVERYDTDDDGDISLRELSQAARDYATGDISLRELSEVASAYAAS